MAAVIIYTLEESHSKDWAAMALQVDEGNAIFELTLAEFKNELIRRGYTDTEMARLGKIRRKLKNRQYKKHERLRKRVKTSGDNIRWKQWECREILLIEMLKKVMPPEVVTIMLDSLPKRPPKLH